MRSLSLTGLLDATLLLDEVLPCARLASLWLLLSLGLGLLRDLPLSERSLRLLGSAVASALTGPREASRVLVSVRSDAMIWRICALVRLDIFALDVACTQLTNKKYYSNFFYSLLPLFQIKSGCSFLFCFLGLHPFFIAIYSSSSVADSSAAGFLTRGLPLSERGLRAFGSAAAAASAFAFTGTATGSGF